MSDAIIAMRGTVYESGYGLIAKKVMKDKSISIKAKALYAYLSSFAGSVTDRSAFPGVSRMLDDLGISKDSFYKYRKELEKAGYITIVQEKNPDGTFKNNIYYIEAVPCPKIPDTEPCPKKPDTDKPDTKNQDNNNNSSNNNNSNKNNLREGEDKPNLPQNNSQSLDDLETKMEFEYVTLQEMSKRVFGSPKSDEVDVESIWNHWHNRFPQYDLTHIYAVMRATRSTARPKDDITGIIVKRLESAPTALVPIKRVAINYVEEMKNELRKNK